MGKEEKRCVWRQFSALVFIEGSVNEFPSYTIEGIFEEGISFDLEGAPDGIIMLRITHHSEDPCSPSVLTPNPDQGAVNFFGIAMVIESQLPDEVLKAIRAGKRLMVCYDYDPDVDYGVGPGGHRFPLWNNQ